MRRLGLNEVPRVRGHVRTILAGEKALVVGLHDREDVVEIHVFGRGDPAARVVIGAGAFHVLLEALEEARRTLASRQRARTTAECDQPRTSTSKGHGEYVAGQPWLRGKRAAP